MIPLKVSIVVATYKQPDTLPLAINSLLDQTYPNIEIIIVSVKGDQPTETVIKSLPSPPVKHIISDVADYIVQRNMGIKEAEGKYVTLFDSDDFALPTKIMQEVKLAEQQNAVLVYSSYIFTDQDLNPVVLGAARQQLILAIPSFNPPSYEALLQNCYIYDYSLVRRTMYEEFDVFDPELKQAAMWDKWLHIMEKYPARVAYNQNPTFLYRRSPEQMSVEQQRSPEHRERVSKVIMASIKRKSSKREQTKPEWTRL